MNCEYDDKINDYLDGNLEKSEIQEFEKYLNNNKEFKNIVDDIKFNNSLIKQIPKIKTSSNFIVNLNNKIDQYDNKNQSVWYDLFSFNKYKIDSIPLWSALSLFIIVSFSLFKFSSNNYIVDDSNYESSIAINDIDSLKNQDDSYLENDPILLIGNDK